MTETDRPAASSRRAVPRAHKASGVSSPRSSSRDGHSSSPGHSNRMPDRKIVAISSRPGTSRMRRRARREELLVQGQVLPYVAGVRLKQGDGDHRPTAARRPGQRSGLGFPGQNGRFHWLSGAGLANRGLFHCGRGSAGDLRRPGPCCPVAGVPVWCRLARPEAGRRKPRRHTRRRRPWVSDGSGRSAHTACSPSAARHRVRRPLGIWDYRA
jgi:hypothetical protein